MFGNFQGREKEMRRIMSLIQGEKVLTGMHLDFFMKKYDFMVPYHNHVHVGNGLLFLLSAFRDSRLDPRVFTLMNLWLAHDAGHNGNSAESPEEKSMQLYKEEKWFDIKVCPEGILDTKFPYAAPAECQPMGDYLRILDTLRPASGIVGADMLMNGCVYGITPFHAYLFENALLFLELNKEPLEWLEKGQVGFFFPQIFSTVTDKISVGNISFPFFPAMTSFAVKNLNRLKELLSTDEGKGKLLKAIEFLQGDVTLPEFVEFCLHNNL